MSALPLALSRLSLALSVAATLGCAVPAAFANDDHKPAKTEKADKPADKSTEKADKPAHAEAKAEAKPDAKAEMRPESETRAEAKSRMDAKAAARMQDPMDRLRERLAEKLGSAKAAQPVSPNMIRVVSKPSDSGAGEMRSHVSNISSGMNVGAGALASRTTPNAARLAAEYRAAAYPQGRELPASAAPAVGHAPNAAHWGYAGAEGPESWGSMRPEFAACSSGARQSPIDIRDGIKVQLEPVQFDYRASGFSVIDNGHTVQVNVAPGNSIEVLGRRYELVQFHFHRPSEERINGRQYDMVVHLVHKDLDGKLAVVAVLLDRGNAHPIVQSVWNNLPLEKGDAVAARSTLDLDGLLPQDRSYFTYMGSLTTPPCSEGVLWMVLRNPVGVSADQIAIFSRIYPMNARPIQSASGRMIKESN